MDVTEEVIMLLKLFPSLILYLAKVWTLPFFLFLVPLGLFVLMQPSPVLCPMGTTELGLVIALRDTKAYPNFFF